MNTSLITKGALTLALTTISIGAHAQEVDWMSQFGTAGDDDSRAIAVDSTGIYSTGVVRYELPGQTSVGANDAYLRKFDSDGNVVWTRQFGTVSTDWGFAVFADSSGVYVGGFTHGAFPGKTNAGSIDAFVCKYDSDGTLIWVSQFGTSSFDRVRGISVDASGIYVTGSTGGAFSGQSSSGNTDAFVGKLDVNGNPVWFRQFGTSGPDWAHAISADDSGIYVSGDVRGSLPGFTLMGYDDAFLRKYDSNGNEIWTRQFGTSSTKYRETAKGVIANATGVYIVGGVAAALPGQSSYGSVDAFARKYDEFGNVVWTRQFGSSSVDSAQAVAIDSLGIYVSGFTFGTMPGQTSSGNTDVFVRNYDFNGGELWTVQFGSASIDRPFGIGANDSGIYVGGQTAWVLPGQTSAGNDDAFVVRIGEVIILTPQEAIEELLETVVFLNLNTGIENSLDAKLDAVLLALSDTVDGNDEAAIKLLEAFIAQVDAQSGNQISVADADADALIASAQAIIDQLL